MRDITNCPLSPNQRKEVEEYMNNHNVTENEARYMLGYVPGDIGQISIEESFDIVKKENPNLELSYKTIDIWVEQVMKHAIPKPNPKRVRGWIETTGMLCFEPSIFSPPVELDNEMLKKVKLIICPDCGYEIEMNGYSNALAVELIENKKSAIMCPMCFTPFESKLDK